MFKMKSREIMLNDLPQVIQCSIQKIVTNKNLITYNVTTKNISTGGNNFMGELYEIDIHGVTGASKNIKLHIFLKHIIKNDDFKIYSIPEVYAKEAFIYLELCNIFHNLQEKANIPFDDRLNIVESYEETNNECIILKNFAKEDYKTMNRMEIMPLEFAQKSISQLAKFHALSLVLEIKDPTYYETKIKTIKQSFVYDEYWNNFVKKIYDISVSKLDDTVKNKLDEFFQVSLDKYPKYMNGTLSTLKCLCHGDYKMNNILYKEEDGHITCVTPIDFQQVYYGSPVMDLIYFIYAASDLDFRKENLNNLKDLYYDTLMSFLRKYFDIDGQTICSKQDFDRLFANSLDYAPMYTLYMLPFLYVVDGAPSGKDDVMDLSLNLDDRFYIRIKEIVDEFIGMNII